MIYTDPGQLKSQIMLEAAKKLGLKMTEIEIGPDEADKLTPKEAK